MGRYILFRSNSTLVRGVAVLLLAFTFVDLVFVDLLAPQLCDGEGINVPITSGISTVNPSGDAPPLMTPETPGPELPSHTGTGDEDCFCCCSHIIPSAFVSVARLDYPLPLVAHPPYSLPTPPPQDTFHPPRHA